MIANGRKELRRKSDIVAALSDELNLKAIKSAIEHIQDNPELQRVGGFIDNCAYVLQHINLAEKMNPVKRESYAAAYDKILDRIKMTVEDYGIPRKGHLNDEAKNLLQTLESPEFSYLLDNPQTAISYGKVRAHYRGWNYTKDYEGHLHNLYAIVKKAKSIRPLKESKLVEKIADATPSVAASA